FIIALVAAGNLANLHEIYYIGIAFAATHLGAQVKKVDIDDPDACLSVFRSNISFGWIVFFSLIAGQLVRQL
ncbi:MAG: 4-hydroxybenzoate octaprenyltransferase, partial [Kordiimonas sp.]